MADEAHSEQLLGEVAATKLPLKLVHGAAALIFAAIGVAVLTNVGDALAWQ